MDWLIIIILWFWAIIYKFYFSKCFFLLVDNISSWVLSSQTPLMTISIYSCLYYYVAVLSCLLESILKSTMLAVWIEVFSFFSFLDKSMVDNNHSLIWEDYSEILFSKCCFWLIYDTSFKSKFKPLGFAHSGYYANLDLVASAVKWETIFMLMLISSLPKFVQMIYMCLLYHICS